MTFSWLFGSSSHMLAQMCTAHLPFAKKKEHKRPTLAEKLG